MTALSCSARAWIAWKLADHPGLLGRDSRLDPELGAKLAHVLRSRRTARLRPLALAGELGELIGLLGGTLPLGRQRPVGVLERFLERIALRPRPSRFLDGLGIAGLRQRVVALDGGEPRRLLGCGLPLCGERGAGRIEFG